MSAQVIGTALSTREPARDERVSRYSLEYLRHAPLALCVRELNRLIAYESISAELPAGYGGKILDVGCGDGHWWALQKESGREVFGVDISAQEIEEAKGRIRAELVDISREVPFPEHRFARIVGNCSLEHVRDIRAALEHLWRAADDRGQLILFVPTPGWAFQGAIQSFLLRRFPRVAMAVAGALNGFFQHWHLYELPVWEALLRDSGWSVRKVYGMGNARSEFLFRLFLPLSIPAFLFKTMFGCYPNRLFRCLPDLVLAPMRHLIEWALDQPLVSAADPSAYEYAILAEKEER